MPNRKPLATYAQAKDNPFELFTVKELAAIHCVSEEVISCCFKMGARNHFQMSRPEWIMEFMHSRPEPLQCKDAKKDPKIVPMKPRSVRGNVA